MHPQPRVQNKTKHTSVVTTGTPVHPAFPHAMVLTVTSCSPRRSGLFVTVASGVTSADLTPASRRQDHTTSPSAVSAIRLWCHRVHRIPCPTFVTIAKRPSVLGRDGEDEGVIWVKSEPEYFCKGDWTSKPVICPVGQSADCSAPAEALQLPDRRGGFRRRRCTMRHGERDLAGEIWRARLDDREAAKFSARIFVGLSRG